MTWRALVVAVSMSLALGATAGGQLPILHGFDGDSAQDWFGTAVSGAGDVDGDGFGDVIVGAAHDDNNGSNSGSARVLSGFDGSILYTFDGDSAGDLFGWSVSDAGDVDGDGFGDVIVGAIHDDNNGANSGSARVLSGFDGSVLYAFDGDSGFDFFGQSVSGAGDVNGDGFGDVIVGAYTDDNNGSGSGSARVFSGFDGAILYTFNGDSAGDWFGFSVGGAGDVNGDGFADVIVGAYKDDNNGPDSGSARVLSGFDGSILYTFDGDSAGDGFGFRVSDAGDVNGDGIGDLVVGAPFDGNNGSESGSARVFSGSDGSILYTFDGDSADDRFGWAASGAGDANGDGFGDVIVGAIWDDNNGLDSGSARVFSGVDGSVLYTFEGDSADDVFGLTVGSAGDVNGDGFDDVIVGAYLDDNNGSDSGSVVVLSVCGAEPYGGGLGGTQTLALDWSPGLPGSRANGFITVQGAATAASGVIALSYVPALASAFGVTLLVDGSPTNTAIIPFAYSPFGSVVFPVDIEIPTLANTVVFLQAFELGAPAAPSGVFASNGLQLLMCR